MKTPREILFEKHKCAEQKLDAIRAHVVAEHTAAQLKNKPSSQGNANAVSFLAQLWQELFWPYRRIWTGLAVVWVGIIALHVSEPGTATRGTVKVTPQMAAAVIVEQQRELALVLGETESPQAALLPPQPPLPALPRPRSERRVSIVTV